jgi:multidrug resistance efflux pump
MVSVTGVLVPEHYAYLSFPGAGSVAEIAVHEGQSVTQNQQLMSLEELAAATAALTAAELEYEAAQQALDELHQYAEIEKNAAWIALLDAKTQYNAAEAAWENLDKDALQDDIDEAREDILESEEDLEDAQDDFNRYADLEETNTLRQRYEDDLEEAQENYNEQVRALDELIIELQSPEASWKSAAAVLEQAQADYDVLLDGPDPDKLALAEARLANAAAQKEAAQEQLDQRVLYAPFNSVVADLMVSEEEWVGPGQPVALLADLDSLQVETTDLTEIDVVMIEVGDRAEITFDAIPDEVFEGIITEISPKAADGAGVNYTVVIKLIEIPNAALWGMTVFVDIDTQQ